MGVTIEFLGNAQLCREITVHLEHWLSGRQACMACDVQWIEASGKVG
jgi:hypothetical protein